MMNRIVYLHVQDTLVKCVRHSSSSDTSVVFHINIRTAGRILKFLLHRIHCFWWCCCSAENIRLDCLNVRKLFVTVHVELKSILIKSWNKHTRPPKYNYISKTRVPLLQELTAEINI